MTVDEQAVELARLEARAKSLGISDITFNRIALDATHEARGSSVIWPPAQMLDEIRRRIEPPGTRKPGTL